MSCLLGCLIQDAFKNFFQISSLWGVVLAWWAHKWLKSLPHVLFLHLVLPQLFVFYFSMILNYFHQEHNTMNQSIYCLLALPSQHHNIQQFEFFSYVQKMSSFLGVFLIYLRIYMTASMVLTRRVWKLNYYTHSKGDVRMTYCEVI